MSGHGQGTSTRVLKSSPNTTKQGPMKATLPMASLLKQNSSLRKSISPSLSPTSCWKARISPDYTGLRSPGSSVQKTKSRMLGSGGNPSTTGIRRTASLDTIYLQGQWPRDIYCMPPLLQIDKATQTEDSDWKESRKIQFIQDADEKLEKIIRQRLQRSNNQQLTTSRSQLSPVTADHTLTASSQTNTSCIIPRATPVNIPIKQLPKSSMRNSIEGLNQEIERLVLKSCISLNSERNEDYDKITPEGHRAPFPDLYRNTRSVNTQTPSANDLTGSCQSSSGSRSSSPEQDVGRLGTSPRIFLTRGPPDGCERVNLKSIDERRSLPLDLVPQPSTFQFKPSQGSAFKILQPNLHFSKQNVPLVPSEQDLI